MTRHRIPAHRHWLAGLALGLATCTYAQLPSPAVCGPLENAFGPFEYRPEHFKLHPMDHMPHREKLQIVESYHFTPRIEALIGIGSGSTHSSDLDYTLRAFPNHHRALAALLKWAARSHPQMPAGLPRPFECYFERAIRFSPNDPLVRILYASFLIKKSRIPEANSQLEVAVQQAEDNGFTHYNIGLVYLEANELDAALKQAHRALLLGFPRTELKQRLAAAGRWSDPESAEVATPGPGNK